MRYLRWWTAAILLCLGPPAIIAAEGAPAPAPARPAAAEEAEEGTEAAEATEAVAADEEVLEDIWYAVYQGGKKIGHQHTWTVEDEIDGRQVFISRLQQASEIRRGPSSMSSMSHLRTVEDADGGLIRFTKETITGGLPRVTEGRVADGELILTIGTAEKITEHRVPVPKGLCDWALTRKIKEKGLKPGTSYELPVFDADLPTRDITVKVTIGDVEDVKIYDEEKKLHRARLQFNIAAGQLLTVWMDDNCEWWLVRIEAGVVVHEVRRTTKEVALGPNEEVDAMAASRVKCDKEIKRARRLETMRILLKPVRDGFRVPDVPDDAWQHAKRVDEGVELLVHRAHPNPDKSYRLPYAGDEYARLLEPTLWLETEDERLVKMSRDATGGETEAFAAARSIERYVRKFIVNKNYGVGMATAAEIAQRRSGDCSEHAMLLAALARGAGIPSRAVGGLVYTTPGAEGGFEFHMWTEVFVGEWFPLDAALFGHDATHIALVRSNLDETDLLKLNQAISRFLGRVEARIQELSYNRPAAGDKEPQ